MTGIEILKASDRKPMPWKNGGGETIEIAVHPADASLETFDWRLSIATVAVDGPFSTFAGIDRTIAVLTGDGMDMRIDGKPQRLTPETVPFPFQGDSKTEAWLIGGPVRDLNIMSRRTTLRHRMERLDITAPTRIETEGGECLVLAVDACRVGGVVLDVYDVAHIAPTSMPVTVEPQGHARIFVIRLFAA
ncbi:HutD family protein [Rhizobium sp. YJ-22]|uniref:HutD/Ves family protein n=1 Tax=Rhizobium sp. YJ-22 TaxID=3037556 RepID=UPI0024125988|nr:HutD family protein [Rhizobium sp. YJ-22]MDG3579079.1 HutD family protein [Rhizobium sp. YJ-22]